MPGGNFQMSTDSIPYPQRNQRRSHLARADVLSGARRVAAYPELIGVLVVAAVLNIWNLTVNGTANAYYAAAVKAMASNWHDFLYNSMDKSGLMTVDKPPLSDWIQALSVRVFGYDSLALLLPQALMGIVATGLMYDLVRRQFGRVSGFVAALVLATTPVIVGVSRHNNPDELLVLLSVAAVWFALRATETGATKWLVWSGVMVGLGFEAKMGVALMLIPAITLAWIWTRWNAEPGTRLRGNARMLRQLGFAGAAAAVVGLAWPILVTLTPAADRPWISGTSNNSVWSLIFGYNGLGRISGQTGGPGGGASGGLRIGGTHSGVPGAGHLFGFAGAGAGGPGGGAGPGSSLFGGQTGVFRLIGSSLGSQAGWLLGFALVALIGLVVTTRLRRDDHRSAFLIVIGGTLLIIGTVFSFASGIFHPYYVAMVAPWAAALIGAGVGVALKGDRAGRVIGAAALLGGAITELVVLNEINGALSWAVPLVVIAAVVGGVALLLQLSSRVRATVIAVCLACLLAAPATWAAETLGHAESGTFPAGGPTAAEVGGSGSFGGAGGGFGAHRFGGLPGVGGGLGAHTFGGFPGVGGFSRAHHFGGFPGAAKGGLPGGAGGGGGGGFGMGSGELDAAAAWASAHGGGTVVVDSQSTAAQAILDGHNNVAGIGGFSGNESTVSASWLAQMVREGRIRYVLGGSDGAGGAPSDGRQGSRAAIALAEKVGRKITIAYDGQHLTLYDLNGKASAILAAANG
jgi:4-amino-4-deoxy-L-arabinose transferase-like glycosyltransferase